jgi:hypothetical protein
MKMRASANDNEKKIKKTITITLIHVLVELRSSLVQHVPAQL